MSWCHDSPKSFTIVARDCRGITLLFNGDLVALGSLIIPEETNIQTDVTNTHLSV